MRSSRSSVSSASEKKSAKLSNDLFIIGATATSTKDEPIYNKNTAALFYDANGTGLAAQVQIATLSKNFKPTHKDFFAA
ncbi:hypothetical protein VB618_12080 [Microvirga sp. CF3062]|uniref:hypothetical protein n=1 Tax=Microvirga sp. CF3062 TaxID=3110182 RepID=UPI002E78B468|nr:hypothetical protein [Microvirga sp. CF3062]MEE1656938.1 hypothetical protein [Microvirga sp. CF3062]